MFEENENVNLSGSDPNGSIGKDSGSASGSGSDGSDGNVDGSDRGINGSGGNADGSNGNGTVSADERADDSASVSGASGNEHETRSTVDNVNRPSRAERERQRQPIRLGAGFGRSDDRDTADSSDAGRTGNGETRTDRHSDFDVSRLDDDQPEVIRLGAPQKGRPRKIKPETSEASDYVITKDTINIIKTTIETIFEIPAATFNQPHWKLSKDESTMLNDAIVQWLKSMPKNRQSKVALFLNEHMPLINLAMVGYYIIAERVKTSNMIYQMQKAARGVGIPITPNNSEPSQVRTPMGDMFNRTGFAN